MGIATGISYVMIGVQLVKDWLKLEGKVVVALAILGGILVTAYKGLMEGWNLNLIPWGIQVIVGATKGYDLLKIVGGANNKTKPIL